MTTLEFNQNTVVKKEFSRAKKITSLPTLNNIIVSKAIPANGGKDQKFIIGYQDEKNIIPLLIKTPENIFSAGVTKYNESSPYTMGFDLCEHQDWLNQYRMIWCEIEKQLLNSLTKNPISKDRYVNTKLKTWDNCITTNFHGCTPENMKCEATGVLHLDSVYKQGSIYYPQVHLQECKWNGVKIEQTSLLSDII